MCACAVLDWQCEHRERNQNNQPIKQRCNLSWQLRLAYTQCGNRDRGPHRGQRTNTYKHAVKPSSSTFASSSCTVNHTRVLREIKIPHLLSYFEVLLLPSSFLNVIQQLERGGNKIFPCVIEHFVRYYFNHRHHHHRVLWTWSRSCDARRLLSWYETANFNRTLAAGSTRHVWFNLERPVEVSAANALILLLRVIYALHWSGAKKSSAINLHKTKGWSRSCCSRINNLNKNCATTLKFIYFSHKLAQLTHHHCCCCWCFCWWCCCLCCCCCCFCCRCCCCYGCCCCWCWWRCWCCCCV